ncbi:cystathionine gamma-lyase [Tamaricihabitans halophyticus]|uniref:Cystathionine gamma-lyase n=1 Tax=Tamaricihabitans halophyticus TaxID=1262583 RepID=A0A4R2QR02_9PSEU|nr:cystathionine gamma-lyase [Tamaricihabitans halophyticus]
MHAGETTEVGAPLLAGPTFAAPYRLDGTREHDYYYGRPDNPTWRALESALGELDGGHCVLFSSGMAAISTMLRAVLGHGDVLVLPEDGYYLVRGYVRTELAGLDLDVREVPTAGSWASAIRGARLVLLETPSNPGLDVCDIAALSELAHAEGALLAVDNTTASPLGQRPLRLDADLVVTSDTKAVAGHSDLILGHVSTRDVELAGLLRERRTSGGAIPGAFEAWLAHRGLGTLDMRLRQQAENAAALYAVLREHPSVCGLRWPGAPEDPAYPLAAKQMRRFGGVLSFELPSAPAVAKVLATSELFTDATSFGGLHSTLDRRARWGDPVGEGFVRLSAGCEDPADLVEDLRKALASTM